MGTGWNSGWIVAVAVLAAATIVGLLWRSRQGRIRAVKTTVAAPNTTSATILLFTTPTCGNCHAVRTVAATVAADVPGVRFQEVDATVEPDRARDLNVWRAPTLIILDGNGAARWRATGVPRRDELAAAARSAIEDAPTDTAVC